MQGRALDSKAQTKEAARPGLVEGAVLRTAPSARPHGESPESNPGRQLEREPQLPSIVCVGHTQCVPAVTRGREGGKGPARSWVRMGEGK